MKHCHLDSQSLTLLLRVLSVINVEIYVFFVSCRTRHLNRMVYYFCC